MLLYLSCSKRYLILSFLFFFLFIGSANDIAETIEHFKNDEILDTFNIDNENVESPTVQRKALRNQQRSLRGASSNDR